jgi:acetyltransferase-like isoleucine patch superfamily enzyme
MIEAQRKALSDRGIRLNARNDEIHFGVGKAAEITLEPDCELRAGRYDIGRIGAYTYLGGGDTVIRAVARIGRFTAIAPNLTAGPVEHPVHFLSAHNLFQGDWTGRSAELSAYARDNARQIEISRREYRATCRPEARITIGNDVWIGEGVFLRRGVTVGDGAVIGARSVVTRDVAPFTIVGGSPAREIRPRFDPSVADELLRLRWWDYGLSALTGVDVTDIVAALPRIARNIDTGQARPYRPDPVTIHRDGRVAGPP